MSRARISHSQVLDLQPSCRYNAFAQPCSGVRNEVIFVSSDSSDSYSDKVETKQHQDTIQSVLRATRILRAFSSRKSELGVSELSRLTGLHKTTVYRLLVTLEQESFVRHSPDNDKYKLGPALIQLGRLALDGIDLVKQALPHMRAVVDETDESVMLEIWDEDRALVIASVDGRRLSRVNAGVGSRMPAHSTAGGKVLLAFLPGEEIDRVIARGLKRYTQNTITDRESLLIELEKVRARGIAFDCEELDIGTCAISAPIFDHSGRVAAAITVAGPTQRLHVGKEDDIAELVQRAAMSVSRGLGYVSSDR